MSGNAKGSEAPSAGGPERWHDLKCWPDYFCDVRTGIKTFELREDDRGFEVGDGLCLLEWDPVTQAYTGEEERRRIGYILRGPSRFGLLRGYVILGFASDRPPAGPSASLSEALTGKEGLGAAAQAERLRGECGPDCRCECTWFLRFHDNETGCDDFRCIWHCPGRSARMATQSPHVTLDSGPVSHRGAPSTTGEKSGARAPREAGVDGPLGPTSEADLVGFASEQPRAAPSASLPAGPKDLEGAAPPRAADGRELLRLAWEMDYRTLPGYRHGNEARQTLADQIAAFLGTGPQAPSASAVPATQETKP